MNKYKYCWQGRCYEDEKFYCIILTLGKLRKILAESAIKAREAAEAYAEMQEICFD